MQADPTQTKLYARVSMLMKNYVMEGKDDPEFRLQKIREWDKAILSEVKHEPIHIARHDIMEGWANLIGQISNAAEGDTHLLQNWITSIKEVVELPETKKYIDLLGRIADTQVNNSPFSQSDVLTKQQTLQLQRLLWLYSHSGKTVPFGYVPDMLFIAAYPKLKDSSADFIPSENDPVVIRKFTMNDKYDADPLIAMRLPELEDSLPRLETEVEIQHELGRSPDTLEDELDYTDYAIETMKKISKFGSWGSYVKKMLSKSALLGQALAGAVLTDPSFRNQLIRNTTDLAKQTQKYGYGGESVINALQPTGTVAQVFNILDDAQRQKAAAEQIAKAAQKK